MSTKTILIVDDDPDYVQATRLVLEAEGYKIIDAGDPESARKKIAEGKPSLILLDVMMINETDGFHLAKELKDSPDTSEIPILMMTAIGKKRDFRYEGEKDKDYLPVDGYIEKPCPPEELKAQVNKILS